MAIRLSPAFIRSYCRVPHRLGVAPALCKSLSRTGAESVPSDKLLALDMPSWRGLLASRPPRLERASAALVKMLALQHHAILGADLADYEM